MKPQNVRVILLLTGLEGLAAAALLLAARSEAGSARLFGYSATRLGLALAALLLGLALLVWAIQPGWPARAQRLEGWLRRGERLFQVTSVLLAGMLLLAGAFLFTWLFVPPPLRSLIAWAWLACLQTWLLLLISFGSPPRPSWWSEAALPRLRTLTTGQRRVLALLALVGLVYFALFIQPNLWGAETPHNLSIHGGDENIVYPILTQMFAPGSTLSESIYHRVIYEDYHYGYPFYVASALALLPSRLAFGPDFAAHTQVNLLLLRQLVSVLPMLLSALILTYLMTRFRRAWIALALFVFLLIVPGVVRYNLRFWHPDGMTVLAVALTLYFLDRDRLRLGPNFFYAAILCGLASAIRLAGFFFFLAVGGALLIVGLQRKSSWRTVLARGAAFAALMALTSVLANPFLFHPAARARFGEIMAEKTGEMRSGYDEPDPEGVYRTGIGAWLPFVERNYGGGFFLSFTLISLLAGAAYGPQPRANLLALAWFLPAMGYLVFFVAVKSFQYMLPPMLPFLAGAFNLPLLVEHGWPRDRRLRRVLLAGAVALLLLQAAIWLAVDVALWLERMPG